MSGAVSWHAGATAEDRVASHYARRGGDVRHRRWRGRGGEIDLVVRSGGVTVFVEVKAARTHAEAAQRLRARQAARVMAAAEEFCAGEPEGALTEMRFDLALVDASGRIEILENALMA
jgi:putative endonuclease